MGKADNLTRDTTRALEADVARLMAFLKEFGRRHSLRDPLFAACEDFELTPPQMHSIAWLGGEGPLTMGELSRRIGITEKTITGIVDRLEGRGFVTRERDAEDRRVVHVKLTPQGTALYGRIDHAVKNGLGRLLGYLDDADRVHLFDILLKLQTRMDEAPPTGGAGDEA